MFGYQPLIAASALWMTLILQHVMECNKLAPRGAIHPGGVDPLYHKKIGPDITVR
ncbi:MAG: hypothetical protein MUC83_15615 [Pirellula sp.]|nr:hypothetical protein [Pirellula sp.]